MQILRLVQLIKPIQMYNLSELIKTDCCIDCGTNEKLREVVGKIPHAKSIAQRHVGICEDDIYLLIEGGKHTTFTDLPYSLKHIPIASINIDL